MNVDDGVDVLHAEAIVSSTFSDRHQVYLLNAEPGRYVVVGAYTPGSRSASDTDESIPSTNVYFDRETIPATEVVVKAGEIACMGEITVKASVGRKNADEAQNHYGDLIGRGIGWSAGVHVSGPGGGTSASVDIVHFTRAASFEGLARDARTERRFWKRAVRIFKRDPDWRELIERRLDAMDQDAS